MALSDIMGIISIIIMLLDKLTFIFLSFFFGNMAFKGWTGRKNIIFTLASTIILGFLCFFGGLIIKDYLKWDFFASDYICSIIVAGIFYLLLKLISTGFRQVSNYVTKKDINSLTEDVKNLKIQVAKISKALGDKNIQAEALSEEEITNKVLKQLGGKINNISRHENMWILTMSTGKGLKTVTVDAYTGSIAKQENVQNPLQFLSKNPLSTIGIILSLALISLLAVNITPTTVAAFSNAFDFSFLFEEPLPEGCYTASSVLENFEEGQGAVMQINTTRITNALKTEIPNYYLISSMTQTSDYANETFIITTSYSSQVSSLADEITVSDWQNIYNLRICVFKQDYTLCECIGGEHADPLFTAPYLIKLGFLEQALQNIIIDSISSAIGI